MSLERAFLESIAAEPDNELNRFAYADWLEERGDDTRAEFVRLQCELARDERDRHLGSLKRREMKEREAELLEAHEAEWAGAAAEFKPLFRGGVLERVTLDEDNVGECTREFQVLRTAMPTIAGLKLVWVARHDMNSDDVHELLGHEALRGLRELDLTYACSEDGTRQAIAEMGNFALERLNLHNCDVDVNVMQLLAQSPHLGRLRELNLGGNDLSGCGQILANSNAFPCLETLALESSWFGFDEIAPMVASPSMRHLRRLNLSHNGVDNRVIDALADSSCTFRLRELDLGNCRFEPGAMAHLAASARFSELESLQLEDNYLALQDAQALAGSPRLGKLETLSLSGTLIGNDGVSALVGSVNLAGLRNLHLHGLRNADNEVQVPLDTASIAALPGLSRLHSLNIGQNAIGATRFAVLLASPHLGELRELNVSGNPIGPNGARALAAADGLPNLHVLGLNICELGNAGLEAMAQSTGLRALRGLKIINNGYGGSSFAMRSMQSAVVGAAGPLPMTLAGRALLDRSDPRHVRVRE